MNIGYARVSTGEQTLDLQLDALAAAGCDKLFTETAGGALVERASLMEALEYARQGDTLVVWRLDRLGRSLRHLIETVAEPQGRGVGFRSLTEQIDTTTPGGKLVFHVFGALAEFERDLIRERTQAGLTAARARGKKGAGRRSSSTRRRWRSLVRSTPTGRPTLPRSARRSGSLVPHSTGIFRPRSRPRLPDSASWEAAQDVGPLPCPRPQFAS